MTEYEQLWVEKVVSEQANAAQSAARARQSYDDGRLFEARLRQADAESAYGSARSAATILEILTTPRPELHAQKKQRNGSG